MGATHAIDDYVDLLLSPAPGSPAPVPGPVTTPAPAPAADPEAPPAADSPGPQAVAPAPASQPQEDRLARWLRLRCGDQTYALELLKIREVMLPATLLPLRGVGPAVSGIMNLRGQVVPVLDLDVHFGGEGVATTPDTRIVVLEEGSQVLGLRVSCVEDIILIDEAGIEDARSSQLAPVGDQRIRGIARLGGGVMLLLDAACLLATPLH